MAEAKPLLRVEELAVSFPSGLDGRNEVLDRISFSIREGEILGVVGESGSGKTVTSLAIMQLIRPPGRIDGGGVWFKGENLLGKSDSELRDIRGSQISMIFQNPRSSLNPLTKVGHQLGRVYKLHFKMSEGEAKEEVHKILRRVGISETARVAESYPHQLSGGMGQRAMIAMMVACKPDLLIADEPTTALDVTIAAQIFVLIKDVQAETGSAILLITHDLGVVAETCQRVVVMHAGHVVEIADVQAIFHESLHPYTAYLLRSVLRVDKVVALPGRQEITREEGMPFSTHLCRFSAKCKEAMPVCFKERPGTVEVKPGHFVFCHLYSEKR